MHDMANTVTSRSPGALEKLHRGEGLAPDPEAVRLNAFGCGRGGADAGSKFFPD